MRIFKVDELPKVIVLAWTILVFASLTNAQASAKPDDNDDKKSPTPPGLYITPTALTDAVQQQLNPGLTNYPDFVAGEAVKAVVSPDGNTLAILTAGMNSLYYPNTWIRREFQCFRSKSAEKPAFVSKIFAAVARFSQT